MNQEIISDMKEDENGNPAGGTSKGVGIDIRWQDGPLGRGANKKEPNGAFVEGVIETVIQRVRFYQDSKFKCPENTYALTHLEEALHCLNRRTADREKRNVEGTHGV